MASSSTPANAISSEELDANKAASRRADVRAIETGEKTLEQVHKENMPFRLSGERIDYASSQSPLW